MFGQCKSPALAEECHKHAVGHICSGRCLAGASPCTNMWSPPISQGRTGQVWLPWEREDRQTGAGESGERADPCRGGPGVGWGLALMLDPIPWLWISWLSIGCADFHQWFCWHRTEYPYWGCWDQSWGKGKISPTAATYTALNRGQDYWPACSIAVLWSGCTFQK